MLINIIIESRKVESPESEIFEITIKDEDGDGNGRGVWRETFDSQELSEAFMRGVRAILDFIGDEHLRVEYEDRT